MELVREHTVHILGWCWSEQAVCAVHVVSVPRCVIPSPLRAHETARHLCGFYLSKASTKLQTARVGTYAYTVPRNFELVWFRRDSPLLPSTFRHLSTSTFRHLSTSYFSTV
jgi:hypothetical protein